MSSILYQPPQSAHLLGNNRLSPSRDPYSTTPSQTMSSSRKRKASEEPENDRMSTSPTASPSISGRPLPQPRAIKRTRTGAAQGHPLAFPRLLETLTADQMRDLLSRICEHQPELQQQIVNQAPRPSVKSTLAVLEKYEKAYQEAFPLGSRTTSDYAYNRVQQHLLQLIDAVKEYTPYFLPPHETLDGQSLTYLDAVTNMIHRLPDWDTYLHSRHKSEAYEEISRAWALVIREAAKRAGGMRLQVGHWDDRLVQHNQKSGGKMEEALNELKTALGYMQAGPSVLQSTPGLSEERASVRQQLFSGSYGYQPPHLGAGIGQNW